MFEREAGYENALLIHREGLDGYGRRIAHKVPALSDDLGFDLVSGSLGITGMAPPGHRVDQNGERRQLAARMPRLTVGDLFQSAIVIM